MQIDLTEYQIERIIEALEDVIEADDLPEGSDVDEIVDILVNALGEEKETESLN